MNCRARILIALVISALAVTSAAAQVVIQPTPNPTVTAENEGWYLNGEPVTHAGSLYYPAGPRVYFNANEMVRSGFHMGIPLYTRTTIEPYSVVYLPVGPGVLQPYERPRTGVLTQTSGSIASSLPSMPGSDVIESPMLQAGGSASQTTRVIPVQIPVPRAVGTTGQMDRAPELEPGTRSVTPRRPTHTVIGRPPQGSNAIFIEYEGHRWFKAGAAEPLDTNIMSRAGNYRGIPVWTAAGEHGGIIYVPVTREGVSLAVPYSRQR